MADLDIPLEHAPLAVVDVETTGLGSRMGDRICEIAILRCDGPDVVDSYQQMVNPKRKVSPGAFAVHGITDELLKQSPPFADIADDVYALLDQSIVIAHNAPFDMGFVSAELRRSGLPMPAIASLDTLALARRTIQARSYALGNLATALGIQMPYRAHRAMADVLTTHALFWEIVQVVWDDGHHTVEALLQLQGHRDQVTAKRPDIRTIPSSVPPEIVKAIRERGTLHLVYISAGGERTERFVQPLGLAIDGAVPRLMAYCLLRNDRRSFRLDRILEVDLVLSDQPPKD